MLGLDVLIESDGRFNRYKDTLFSQTSLELDREKMVPAEEAKVNKSICWYLQLLSGYLQLHPALKTLEYLIRRYLYVSFGVPIYLIDYYEFIKFDLFYSVGIAEFMFTILTNLFFVRYLSMTQSRLFALFNCWS